MIKVTVLGATGSIGMSTLDVIARHPERYRVHALTANSQAERMAALCQQHRPRYAVMVDEAAAERLSSLLQSTGVETEVLSGTQALDEVASDPAVDYVMAAIVGAAGLNPSLAAARAGKRVLLANKEALVMSGQLFMDTVKRYGAELLPIDSEHNAIFQSMPGDFSRGLGEVGVERILLTASGGPFRETPLAELKQVTPEQACAHPNWSMGPKISVDSSTMMNKGLEVIEACWLFAAQPQQIQVVIHPQSIIHSMVEYSDGSILSQMGNPDMRTPIAHAMAWPHRIESGVERLDLFSVARLDFEPPDMQRFPCLRLAYEAIECGGTAPAILNAANEVAVEAFLQGQLDYLEIPGLIESSLTAVNAREADSLSTIFEDDALAREQARAYVERRA